MAAGSGDVAVPGQAMQGDGEVPEGGHDSGAVAGADLGCVLGVGDVADVVQGLDLPVPADPARQLGAVTA